MQVSEKRGVGDPIAYRLNAKNYDDLRHEDYQAPRILVVVFVPEQLDAWTSHAEEGLTLRYCAYWTSLRGRAPSNQMSTTIYLSRANRFSAAALQELMERIGRGEVL